MAMNRRRKRDSRVGISKGMKVASTRLLEKAINEQGELS